MTQDSNSQPPSVSATSPAHTDIEKELARVNTEMYERNLELAIRNRTLLVLRKMYEIMNTSLGVEKTAQKLIEAIIKELKFQAGFIALINKKDNLLQAIATSQSESVREAMDLIGKPLRELSISLKEQNNFCVSSVLHNQRRMTNSLFDVLTPLVDEKTASKMEGTLNIKTSVLSPLIFGGEVLGILVLGMDKHVGDLSRAERETLKELIDVIGIAIERAQIYADLKTANDKLKEVDRLKDEFVSVTSHELRTPMTAIKSYVWMVLNKKAGEVAPKAHEYLDKVYISTERLINLVNDMLDVSRIESGRIQLQIVPLDLHGLASQVKDEFLAKVVERNMGFEVLIPIDTPKVLADKEKIHQVLENLVGNAFKFTPNGGRITIESKTGDGYLEIMVSDTGRGITAEDLPKLFTKFGRLGNSLVSVAESGGTGLGLYICKQIIDLHKGKIWVESEIGHGTRFRFTLPKA